MIDHNTDILALAANELTDLLDKVVFVGGSTVGLYITDIGVPEVRATIDVDCVVELTGRIDFYKIEEKLRRLGFKNAIGGPTCRFLKGSLILDVMPTDPAILGFSNKWYSEGVEKAIKIKLSQGPVISIFSLPYFLASKLEAFKGRGKGDFRMSHDIEDLIAVIDGNDGLIEKLRLSEGAIKEYLHSEFDNLQRNSDFLESIEGHISDRTNSQARAQIVLKRVKEIAQI